MPDLGESFADTHIIYELSLWNTEQVEQEANIYSNECGPGCSCSSLLTLTMWCALPPAGGWGPLPEWRWSCVRRLPSCKSPPVVRTATSCPVIRIRLTFLSAWMHIWGDREGPSVLDPDVFSSFLWVSICASTEGLTLYRGFNKNSTARGRLTGDKWSYCVFVCLETPILFLSGKTKEQVKGCPAPLHLRRLIYCVSGTSFLYSLFFA